MRFNIRSTESNGDGTEEYAQTRGIPFLVAIRRPEAKGRMATIGSTTTVTTMPRQVTPPPQPLILHLRLPEAAVQPPDDDEQGPVSVTWDTAVVDNEGMGKRKSKKCCIFHKQRPYDESSSESEDDDEGGWEMDENGVPRWVESERRSQGHGHSHDGCGCDHDH